MQGGESSGKFNEGLWGGWSAGYRRVVDEQRRNLPGVFFHLHASAPPHLGVRTGREKRGGEHQV